MVASPRSRVVFMGTGPFALPVVQELAKRSDTWELAGIVTQPDRAAGRGRQVRRGAVAEIGDALGIPVLQPETFKDDSAFDELAKLEADMFVVASYGRILSRRVLDLPTRGSLNLHPSLLPLYRGPSPVAAAILAGDTSTGATIIEMAAKMDAGPIVAQASHDIEPDDTTEILTARLAVACADLLLSALPEWLSGSLTATVQDESKATYTSMLTKDMGLLDWTKGAVELERQVRAFVPWPVAHTVLGVPVRVSKARVGPHFELELGTVVAADRDGIAVQTAEGSLVVLELQPAGGKRMPASDFIRGRSALVGSRAG